VVELVSLFVDLSGNKLYWWCTVQHAVFLYILHNT